MRISYHKRIQYLHEEELRKLTTTDMLTGAYNRTIFYSELEKWISYDQRYPTELALIMFDIDDFKKVNDTFGHLIGDKVLTQITKQVQGCIRSYDIFTRWGGEEFIILAPNTSLEQAIELATRIKGVIYDAEYEKVSTISCSFVVTLHHEGDSSDSLITRVNQLLYYAKESGKNRVAYRQNVS